MTRSRNALAGGTVLGLQVVLRVGSAFVIAPLLVRFETREALGAYAVILQLIGYLYLLELGFSRALAREVARLTGSSGCKYELGTLLVTAGLFLAGVGTVVAVLTLLLAQSLSLWIDAPPEILSSAHSALLIFSAWMLFKFPLSIFQLILFARQRITLYGTIGLLGDFSRAVFSVAAVIVGFGLTGLAVAIVVSEFLVCFVSWSMSVGDWHTRGMWRLVDGNIVRRLLAVGVPLSLMSLGDRLAFSSQEVLAGWLLGANAAAIIYAMRMPAFTAASLVWRMIESTVPGLNDLCGRGAVAALRSAHFRLTSYALGLGIWLAAGVCTFNRPLVVTWLGAELYLDERVTVAISFFLLVGTMNSVLTHFLTVEGHLIRYPFVVLFSGAMTILFGIAFGRAFGLSGMVWGAALSNLITTPFLLWRNARMLKIELYPMIKSIFRRSLRCAGLGVVACATYASTIAVGVNIPWVMGLLGVLLVGGLGFVVYGLLPQDRATLLAWLAREAHVSG